MVDYSINKFFSKGPAKAMSQLLKIPSMRGVGAVLYMNEDLGDCSVVIQNELNQWRFPAHKLILSSKSPVLRSKLEEESVNDIVLNNVSPVIAELLLCYIYLGTVEVESWNEAIELLELAFKLEIRELVEKCGRFLEDVISISNVCHIYEKASVSSLSVLQDKCLKLILKAGFVVLPSKAFEILNKDCVMDIISSSDLNIDSELTVFETLFRWAQNECCRVGLPTTNANILTQVKPFLQHVCIDDMPDADKTALPPGILSSVKPNNRKRINFTVFPCLLDFAYYLHMEVLPTYLDFVGENLSCMRFSIDSPIYLIGFHFQFTANAMPINLVIQLTSEIVPATTMFCLNLSQCSTVNITRGNQRIWHDAKIVLRQPVPLRPGNVYNMSAKDADSDTQCPKLLLYDVLRTNKGEVRITSHGEEIWGISQLIFL